MKNLKALKNINPEHIYHLEAFINYTIFNLKNGEKFITSYHLKSFEDFFDKNTFIRINRSNLVNRAFISEIIVREKGNFIRLKNNKEFQIPRRRTNNLKKHFSDFFNQK